MGTFGVTLAMAVGQHHSLSRMVVMHPGTLGVNLMGIGGPHLLPGMAETSWLSVVPLGGTGRPHLSTGPLGQSKGPLLGHICCPEWLRSIMVTTGVPGGVGGPH